MRWVLRPVLILSLALITALDAAADEWRITKFEPNGGLIAQEGSKANELALTLATLLRAPRLTLKRCDKTNPDFRGHSGFALVGTCLGESLQDGILFMNRDSFPVHAPVPIPFGYVASEEMSGKKVEALYSQPTDRYAHGALGKKLEGSALVVQSKDENDPTAHRDRYKLPTDQVFEDRSPRLTDLDGFGQAHIVTILTEVTQGASVAVFGIDDNQLTLLAQTPYIGTPNRWLNIAGIDDFDGSGSVSIALVETPHIGGILQFWRWAQGELTKIAEAPGFSNHKFGAREQRLSAVEDFDNDGISDLAVPSADRKALRLVKVMDGAVTDLATVPLPSPIDKAIGVTREGDDVVLTVGLEDGSVWAVHR